MHPVMERAAERQARNDRAMPKIGLTVENSTGHWRTGSKQKHAAHDGSGHSQRFGVKPSGGAVSDLYTGTSNGQDDGTAMMEDWRKEGGLNQLPKAKTPQQDKLKALCIAYIAGDDLGSEIEQGMREFIGKIVDTDHDHGMAWRLSMGIAGLYR